LKFAPFLNKSSKVKDNSILKEALDSSFNSASNELFWNLLAQKLIFWRPFLQKLIFCSILINFQDFQEASIQTGEELAGFTHIVQTSSVGTIIKI
jgi:hypothetical protein